ncbi:MAG: sigma 54-interacting transcriptional regulator [Acidobacteria bacterium]|nr:sigma 54-interacting transcriptional regulator [Acidobacteriota bacterium]
MNNLGPPLQESALTEELSRKFNQMKLLLEIANKITSHLDMRELFKVIAETIYQITGCDAAGMTLYDAEKETLQAYALELKAEFKATPPVQEGMSIPIDNELPLMKVLHSQQTVIVNYQELKTIKSPLIKKTIEDGIKSICSAPLASRGKVLGTVNIVSTTENAFTQEDALLLTQIASQIAIALDNALNFDRARQAEQQVASERDRWRLLLDINNAVVSHLDLKDLVKSIGISLSKLIPLEAVGIALYEKEHNHLRLFVNNYSSPDSKGFDEGKTFPLEGTPGGLVYTSGKPFLLKKPDPERFPADDMHLLPGGRQSCCLAPLISHGRKLGVIGLISTKQNAFTETNLELLNHISSQVAIAVENALAYREIEILKNKLTQEKLYLEEELNSSWNFEQIIGTSPTFKRVLKQVETVAPIDSTVLLYGETGTGKEIIARAIHNLSTRRERTLVKLNCAAIPSGLLESELFGHEKGAFTGAIAQRAGRFELANKGTLLLDEVGEIPLELQPKLLRVLQEQEFERLGSTRTQRVDVRLVAATNRNLAQMVENNEFRSDLYYRLNVFPINIPPLRERQEDIPLLVSYFASKFANRMRKKIETISSESMAALTKYHWPGNIRELENFIERAIILTSGLELQIPITELKPKIPEIPLPTAKKASTLENVERDHILRVLRETNWVVSGPTGAAVRLGMKRSTLQSKMQKLGITRQSSF